MKRITIPVLLVLAVPAFAAVPSTTSRADYLGNGSTKAFAFAFKAKSTTWIEVFLAGVKQTGGFTVALNANQSTAPGGSVTFSTAPGAGATVRIQRTLPLTQDSVWAPYAPFRAQTLEDQLDRLVMQQQQLDRDKTTPADVDAKVAAAAIGQVDPGAALVAPTGSTVARTLSARAADTVNVRDFRCADGQPVQGDGVHDDTTGIQAAIDSLTTTTWQGSNAAQNARGGGTILLPAGVFRTTAPIRVGPHVRLIGEATRGFFHPAQTIANLADLSKQKGTVIYADFPAGSVNAWAMESAVFKTADGSAYGYKETPSGGAWDAGQVTQAPGIEVENVFFRSGATPVYGAVRLLSSPVSAIRNCEAFGFKIGFLSSASWGMEFLNLFGLTHWYGIALGNDVNGALISGYFSRIQSPLSLVAGELPSFVPTATSYYTPASLSDYSTSATGVFLNYGISLDLRTITEDWDVGLQFLNASGSAARLYVERSSTVAIVTGGSKLVVGHLYNYASPAVPALHVGSGVVMGVDAMTGNSSSDFLNVNSFSNVRLPNAWYQGNARRLLLDATYGSSGVQLTPLKLTPTILTYGTSLAVDALKGNFFTTTATNSTAFAVSSPTNPPAAGSVQCITIQVRNASGGALGTVSWGVAFKLAAWTSPANGYSRAITFCCYDGSLWVEVSRTPADVPN